MIKSTESLYRKEKKSAREAWKRLRNQDGTFNDEAFRDFDPYDYKRIGRKFRFYCWLHIRRISLRYALSMMNSKKQMKDKNLIREPIFIQMFR